MLPDNYDMWKQHEGDKERQLNRRPKCDICKEHIQDDYLYEIQGEWICEECLNKHFRKVVDVDE